MLYVFYCRKYFCKYVESIKYLLISASLDDRKKEIKSIMYRRILWLTNVAVQSMCICNWTH